MILTVTMNPSIDKTVELPGPLAPGRVQRALSAVSQPGGKGINVSSAALSSGVPTLAVFPADSADPLVAALSAVAMETAHIPTHAPVRTNTALIAPDGETTKVNEPGPAMTEESFAAITELIVERSRGAAWLVLAGSLPPGCPADAYARITRRVRDALGAEAPLVALDTSDGPLTAALAPDLSPESLPDLIKPNGEELAQLLGSSASGDDLEADPAAVAALSADFLRRGVSRVLATLGGHGAVLTTARGSWHAIHAPITVRSTVGAGDSSLAGYLFASLEHLDDGDCLRRAVAYGSAAAGLPGTTIPSPADVTENAVTVRTLSSLATPTESAPADEA